VILADTSIWIDHLRRGISEFGRLAARVDLLMHPFVLTEIALGSLPDRRMTLRFLGRLIRPNVADVEQIAILIERQKLYGSGLGFVDVSLLASALVTPDCEVWTRDRRLAEAATRLGVGFSGRL
jgi:predicted nucleic acid-binding protein